MSLRVVSFVFVIFSAIASLQASSSKQALPKLLSWPKFMVSPSPLKKNQSQVTSVVARPPKVVCILFHEHYIKQVMLAQLLRQKGANWLSAAGSAHVLAGPEVVSICDDKVHRLRLESVLTQLNRAPVQIKIQARIVSVDQQYLRDLGINLLAQGEASSNGTNSESAGGDLTSSGFHLVLAKLADQQRLQLQLHALVEQGHAHVVASPKLITSNGIAANIESGQEVPYQQNSLSGATNVAFKKAVMQLSVTPFVLDHHKVALSILVHQDKVTPTLINGVPVISTEQIHTDTIVSNHDTLVIGGILESSWSKSIQGVPYLQHIPVFGLLFRHHHWQQQTKQLLIFIKPSWSDRIKE